MFTALKVDYDRSPIEPLYDKATLQSWVTKIREDLARDDQYAADKELPQFKESQTYGWFQRVDIPGTRLTSTSDHTTNSFLDPDPLQSFGGLLTLEEASIMRPRAKWCYLEPHIPKLKGKTVLEIGCASGYFSFEFLKSDPAKISSVEIVPDLARSAQYMANALNANNMKVHNQDFMSMPDLEPHDIVFMSEVFTHSPCPFSSLYRSVMLAKETLIIDDFFERDASIPFDFYVALSETPLNLGEAGFSKQSQIVFTSTSISEQLMLKTLRMVGILPEKVRRLRDPNVDRHTLLIIDTRGSKEIREHEMVQVYLQSMMGMQK